MTAPDARRQASDARVAQGGSASERATLSVVVITKNEERQIERCLTGVSWADEMVVVDDESVDRTVELARRLGANVVIRRSNSDFDEQRNAGIDAASGDWILQMDADEVVTPDLRRAIEQALAGPHDVADAPVAYRVRRRNFFLGRLMTHGGWSDAYGVKLFRRHRARYVGHSVHETLRVDGPVGTLNADIEHYPYTSFEQVIDRANHYTSVEARTLAAARPSCSRWTMRYQLAVRPFKLFWKSYIKHAGWKDGMHGALFCVCSAWAHMLRWAKYWELVERQPHGTTGTHDLGQTSNAQVIIPTSQIGRRLV